MTETNTGVEQTRCCDISFARMPWLVSRLFPATGMGIQEQYDYMKIFCLIAAGNGGDTNITCIQ